MNPHWFQYILLRAWGEMRSDASRFVLGPGWWLLEPAAYVGVLYVIFGLVLSRGGEGFVPFLLVGLIVWRWIDGGVRQASNALLANGRIIRQVYVPKWVFPSISVLGAMARFLFAMAIALPALPLLGHPPTTAWLLLPLLLLLQFLFVLGAACMAASLVPLLPDLRVVIDNGLLLLFFLSGIFFRIPVEMVEQGGAAALLQWNPVYLLVDAYRILLLQGRLPEGSALGWVALCAVSMLLSGMFLLRRWDRRYPMLVAG